MMKAKGGLIAAILLLSISACSPRPVTYVAVREQRFRSEVKPGDRIKLPLTVESRDRLLKFFRAGGDTDRIGTEIVDPEAEKRYAPLLDLLSDSQNLALEGLTEKHIFRKWFSGPLIRQVVDAREESPPIIEPVAVTDGKYWWIFYPHQKRLTELLVVKAIPAKMKR
jgi:hypothetical protein